MFIPYDCVGIGFGPSHLSMAIAAEEEEQRTGRKIKDLYLDLREDFSWQPGMLLEDSRMQVVFLKDLISMCNPRSSHTFLNYLFEHDRLHDFINLRAFYPTRAEYNHYYKWVAEAFRRKVRYCTEVTALLPEKGANGDIEAVRVCATDQVTGAAETYLTRNVTIAVGGKPVIPAGVDVRGAGRVFHSSDCKQRLDNDYADHSKPYKFVIVGSGQTAADIFLHLCNHYPNASVVVAMRSFAFKPQDDTHFVNELFFPQVTDLFFEMDEAERTRQLKKHRDVTHSAVDIDLLRVLYDALYRDKVDSCGRLRILRFVELIGTTEGRDHAIARFRNVTDDHLMELEADAVILATGYDRRAPQLLDGLSEYLERDDQGEYQVERSYSIKSSERFLPKVYLEGYCESSHGFSEVLLSLLPVRSAEIIADIVAGGTEEEYDAENRLDVGVLECT